MLFGVDSLLTDVIIKAGFCLVLQTRTDKKHLAQYGLDLINGTIINNVEAGVLEPALSKIKIIQVRLRGGDIGLLFL